MIRQGVILLDSLDVKIIGLGLGWFLGTFGLELGWFIGIHGFIDVLLGGFHAIITIIQSMVLIIVVLTIIVVVIMVIQKGVCVTQSVKRRVLFKDSSITPHTLIIQIHDAGRVGGIEIADTMTAARVLLALLVGF